MAREDSDVTESLLSREHVNDMGGCQDLMSEIHGVEFWCQERGCYRETVRKHVRIVSWGS